MLPACSSCLKCNNGQYQPSPGRAQCQTCAAGFNCTREGLTYPVAYEGYYISPKDPHQIHQCTLGMRATNANDRDAVQNFEGGHKAGHCKDDNPNCARGSACPGGNLTLAAELLCVLNEDQQLVASADLARNKECKKAVGSVCLDGYAGEGAAACSRCCKQGLKRPDGTVCTKSWWLQTADHQCYECPNQNGAFIVVSGSPAPFLVHMFICSYVLCLFDTASEMLQACATIMGLLFAPFSEPAFQSIN